MSPRTPDNTNISRASKSCPAEQTLVSFVDQDLTPEEIAKTAEHVRHCSRCAEITRRERRWSDALRDAFTLAEPCPDAEQMAALADGGLAGHELAAVERHMFLCSDCHDRLGRLQRTSRPKAAPCAPPKEFLLAALAVGSPIQRCIERARELLSGSRHIALTSNIQAVPRWVEERSAEFQRTVIGLTLVLTSPAHPTASVMLTPDAFTVSGADLVVEVRLKGVTMMRAGRQEGHWRDFPEMVLARMQGQNVPFWGIAARLVGMLAVTVDELPAIARAANEEPSTWGELLQLWEDVAADPEHRRLAFIKALRSHLGKSFEPQKGWGLWPKVSLDSAIQQTRTAFGDLASII